MNKNLRLMAASLVVMVLLTFMLTQVWGNYFLMGGVLFCLFLTVGVFVYAVVNNIFSPPALTTPAPTTPPPPATPINWRLIGVISVLLVVVVGLVNAWIYLQAPNWYLPHLLVGALLLYGLFRSTTLSAYQPLTLSCALAILALSMVVPQTPLEAWVIVTGCIPLLLALGFVFATPGSTSDRWVAGSAVMGLAFVALYAVLSIAGLAMNERLVFSLIGAGVVFVLLPSVRAYLFPGTTFTLTRREWWVIGAVGLAVLCGIIVSFYGVPDFATGLKIATRWLFGSLALILLLVLIWSIDRINLPVKVILTVVVVTLLFRNFVVWVGQAICDLWVATQSMVMSHGLLYALVFSLFMIAGYLLVSWARVRNIFGFMLIELLMGLLFFFMFGSPFSFSSQSGGGVPSTWSWSLFPETDQGLGGPKHKIIKIENGKTVNDTIK